MTAPLCYSFDPETGIFTGSTPADPSPLEEGVWLDPGHSTRDAPPQPGPKQAAVRQNGTWGLVPDHRGETWYRDGVGVVVSQVGDPAAAGLSPDAPPPPAATEVSRTQGLIQLHRAGLLDAYNQAIAAADIETQIWAANAPTWAIDNPYLTKVAAVLSLTDAQVQDLFTAGSKIA